MKDALAVLIVSSILFLLARIPTWLAMLSAQARIRRARSAAEALADDVDVLLEKGELDRAREVAGAHDTQFAEGLRRALRVAPIRRQALAAALGEEWRRSMWSGGALGYGCFVTLVGGIALFYTGIVLAVAIGFGQLHGFVKAAALFAGLLAGGTGCYVLRRILSGARTAREEFAAYCHRRIEHVVDLLDQADGPSTPP